MDAVGAAWRQASAGTLVTLRVGENGPVEVRVWARRVWWWAPGQAAPRGWWLVLRQERDGSCKYTLCNAPAQTPLKRLAVLCGGRYFIERSFEDGKSHLGMGQSQARKWRAWQHHLALVALAQLFVLRERVDRRVERPLRSTRDVVEMLDWYFQSRRSARDVEAALRERHRRRAALAAAALRRAKKRAKKRNLKIPK